MPAIAEKTEISLPQDLAKRYSEASDDAGRLSVMNEYARTLGAEAAKKEAAAHMSNDQFQEFLRKVGDVSADTARAAIKEVAGDAEKRYNLNPIESKEIAERSYETTAKRLENERADMEIAAKVIRGAYLARLGKPQAYAQAIEEEANHYKRVYKRETRSSMTLGTDSTGGYLAPTLFSDMLYDNIARTSLVRRWATMIPMKGNEVINIPTLTASLSAAVVSEAAAGTNSQPTFSQKQLTTKKIMTKTRPVSIEMIEKANPAIIPLLLRFATIEILKAEDSLVFGTSGNGIRNTSTNLVTVGSVGTSATDYSSISFDDMIALESGLDAQYLIGDDVQGSGIITGAPQYWLPHALVQTLKGIKDGTGRYMEEANELRNDKTIFGYNRQRVLSLPDGSSLAALDKVGIFGNLAHVWCGTEPGFRVDILDQATINDGSSDVSLGETGQAAVRVIEFFDSVVIDAEGFTIASMGA